MKPYYTDATVTIHHGDCLDVLRELPAASVDAVVTDPPYLLGFMGREWDTKAAHQHLGWHRAWCDHAYRVLKPGGHMLAFGGTRTSHRLACAVEDAGFEIRDSIAWLYGSGFPKSLDVSKAIDRAAGAEREVTGSKVGLPGYGARNGLSNNANLNDDGWIGVGAEHGGVPITAPATDAARTWQGWGTALKPAHEPIVVARKPLSRTVAANVLEWGCGALNIQACRIGSNGSSGQGIGGEAATRGCRLHDVRPVRPTDGAVEVAGQAGEVAHDLRAGVPQRADARGEQPQLDGRGLAGQEVGLPPRSGEQSARGGQGPTADTPAAGVPGTPAGDGPQDRAATDRLRDGASHQRGEGGQPAGESAPDRLGRALAGAPSDRAGTDATSSGERPPAGCTCGTDRGVAPAGRWPANVVLDESQAAALDAQSGESRSPAPYVQATQERGEVYGLGSLNDKAGKVSTHHGDSGGASRFFYTAKAGSSERVKLDGTAHPTVKPLALMRWLVRLVTPPGGTVLEPFAGSGTTVEACILEGFACIAIEREADYLPLIRQRIHRRRDPVEAVRGSGEDAGLFDLLDGGVA